IGSVPRKQSQEVWLRFRKACDHFFNAKQSHFSNIETEHANNLKLKTELIEEVKQFKGADNVEENLEKLKDFQNRWTQIGQVAFKEKDKIYKEFRASISALYEKLNIKKDALDVEGFKQKVKVFSDTGDIKALRREKSAINQKIKNIENDISLWETNMSFFSGKAEGLLADAKKKIEKAKAEIETLISQRKAIDIAERELSKKEKEN
ncbi:MAG: DUF349 domain-containing protein, partial [Bacteroidales bacterium]|nr:DUF349 domain-containing protein [Bacteroidales bacterium]